MRKENGKKPGVHRRFRQGYSACRLPAVIPLETAVCLCIVADRILPASMKFKFSLLTVAGIGALVIGVAQLGISQDTPPAPPSGDRGIFLNSLTIDKAPLQRGGAILKSYADMLDKVQPSVVTILTGMETKSQRRITQQELFNWRFYGIQPPSIKAGEDRWQQVGIGSGVIVSSDGYILTNRHVIFPPDLEMDGQEYIDALRVRVNIPGRDGYAEAKLVDFSPEMDVAVLKLPGTNYPRAVLADSDTVRVGDIAFAVGAPFGIEKTVTMGIISAKRNDEVLEGFDKQELLQTDASINPGNSGGPLIDADGRVIGINTAIYSKTGGNMGIGFAIPINKAVSAADALSRPRGYLGVRLLEVDQRYARAYGFSGGSVVGVVEKETPAAKSGLQEGDVILSMDGKTVKDSGDLRKRLAGKSPGAKAQIEFFRPDSEKRGELTLTLGERANYFVEPGSTGTSQPASAPPAEPKTTPDTPDTTAVESEVAGMTILPVAEADRMSLKLPEGVTGLIVTRTKANSPAANCGLDKGDIILRINGIAPASYAAAVEAITAHSRDGQATLHVRKDGTTRIVLMDLK